jgi:lipopolysaccharide export system protein LptA
MKLIVLILLCLMTSSAVAEEKQPLEITADKALEWNQTDKTYVARGNAVAKQGDISVKADLLTANYAGMDGNTSDVTLLTAEGHVILSTATDTATGDKAIYDLTTGQATLSGHRPKVTQNGKNTLEADKMIVWTKNNILERAEAIGNVIIISGEQTATGDKATYTAASTTAELIGNVKVKQANNWLQGDRAEMNMTTRVSKMTGQSGTGRVKGVFYTGTKK